MKVGLLGAGRIGTLHARLLSTLPGVETLVVGDVDGARAEALAAKRAGADVLHLGDMGAFGMPEPMNVLTASLAIRGRRHTYRRMAVR